jgi:serine/threonine protein kinase
MTGHKNIVDFYGWCEIMDSEKPELFASIKIVTERLKGGDLTTYMKKDGLTEKQKIKVMLDVAEALEFIHGKDLMHRGTRASNIIPTVKITPETPIADFTCKIFHFGMAKDADNGGSATHIPGSIKYTAPEQIGGSTYTKQVDMWSFAILAFGLLNDLEAYADKKLRFLNDTRIKMSIDKDNLRPDKFVQPQNCREDLMVLYKTNWEKDPELRMTSSKLVEYLKNLSPR